jgi:uncharacterized protein DUF1761
MPFTVNYLAVVVAGVVAFLLGSLWYSPALFARQWMAAHGHTPESAAAMKPRMGKIYAVTFVCMLVTAWVMAVLASRVGVMGVLGGVKLGGITWLGFAATVGLTTHLFSGKALAAYLIDAGYQLVYFILMGVIIAVWR